MKTMCYFIENSSEIETMFEQLDEYGFDYRWDDFPPEPGFIEVYIDCYPNEIADLEEIMKWYV